MNDPQTLQDLVLEAKRIRDTSVRQLAIAAKEHGFKITYTTLHGIGAGTYKSTAREETVRAIAWLAGVSVEDAFTAAGLPVPGPPFADELPPGVDKLSPKARRAVIELLRVLVDEEAGEEHDQRSAPMNPAGESPAPDDAPEGDVVDMHPRRQQPGREHLSEINTSRWAARTGTPSGGPDLTSGEESQDPGPDESA